VVEDEKGETDIQRKSRGGVSGKKCTERETIKKTSLRKYESSTGGQDQTSIGGGKRKNIKRNAEGRGPRTSVAEKGRVRQCQ